MEGLLGHRQPKGPATDKPTSCGYRATFSTLPRPREAGGDLSAIAKSMRRFSGTKRRFAPAGRHKGRSPAGLCSMRQRTASVSSVGVNNSQMNRTLKGFLALALLSGTAVADAALTPVGNGLIDDPDANMTWVADANLFQTQAAQSGNAAAFVN